MPTIIATLKVQEDKVDEARTFLKDLATETLAAEPGTKTYLVHQRKDEPTTFVFFEQYESDEALALHSKNLKSAGAGFAKILAAPPDIVFLEEV